MFKSNENYKNRVKALRKAGIVGSEYSLNTKLSAGQKSYITKKYNEFKHYFENPQAFVVRTLSRDNAKAFADSGYKTVKTAKKAKVFIPVNDGARVTVKGKSAFIEEATRTYRIVASKSKDLISDLEKYGEKRLPKNQFLTVTVGGHKPIHRQFDSKKDMLKYVQAKTTGRKYKGEKLDAWNRSDAIRHLTIVEIVDAGKERRKEIKRQKVKEKQNKKARRN